MRPAASHGDAKGCGDENMRGVASADGSIDFCDEPERTSDLLDFTSAAEGVNPVDVNAEIAANADEREEMSSGSGVTESDILDSSEKADCMSTTSDITTSVSIKESGALRGLETGIIDAAPSNNVCCGSEIGVRAAGPPEFALDTSKDVGDGDDPSRASSSGICKLDAADGTVKVGAEALVDSIDADVRAASD